MTERLADFLNPKFVVALLAITVFAWAYGANTGDATMKGAIIGGFNLALGFYLGSTSSSGKSSDNLGKALDLVQAVAPPPPPAPDVMLKPGETAQAEVRS